MTAGTPPPRPRASLLLWARPSTRGRWPPALRTGLAFALPALILFACGFGNNSVLAALGSFAVLYGERRPYLIRWKVIATGGAFLVATAAAFSELGRWVGAESTPREYVVVAALGALTAGSVFTVIALRLGPPGPFFLILTGGVAVLTGRHGLTTGTLAIAVAAGAVSALIVSMAPALWRPHGPEIAATEAALNVGRRFVADGGSPVHGTGVQAATLNAWSVLHDAAQTDGQLAQRLWDAHQQWHGSRPSVSPVDDESPTDDTPFIAPLPRPSVRRRFAHALRLDSHATISTVRATTAALVAGVVSVAAGFGRPDWAILGAVLILQLGPDRIRGSVRGFHRVLGTLVGLGLFAALHALDLHAAALIVVLAMLNILIELTVTSNYALAVTFITPLALLMGSSPQPLGHQMTDRVLETLLGVVLAVAALWLLLPRAHRRTLTEADRSSRAATAVVLDRVADTVDAPETRVARRDLVWLLLEADMAAADSANDEPAWAARYWPDHLASRGVGYDTLTACWRAGPGNPVPADVRADLGARLAACRYDYGR